MKEYNTLNAVWIDHIYDLLTHGKAVEPRGQYTREINNKQLTFDMRYPVLGFEDRHLSYKYCAAEAYWILTGDNRTETLVPYNKNMINYSDDGITYFGAYGPKVMSQIDYVVTALARDQLTRQAGLTIWRENPPHTKDVPCTVGMFFYIRENKLNLSVFMRSSDAWLGVPYDAFTFTMIACYVIAKLKERKIYVELGSMTITAVSAHLYLEHFEAAKNCLCKKPKWIDIPVPEFVYRTKEDLLEYLKDLRETKPGDNLRWWEWESRYRDSK